MATHSKKQVLNNLSLSFFSLLCGYGIWYICAQTYTITTTCTLPLSFFNHLKTDTFTAPESISVTLKGSRKDLYQYLHTSAVHINANNIPTGQSHIKITETHLFLPNNIILVNCKPLPITRIALQEPVIQTLPLT